MSKYESYAEAGVRISKVIKSRYNVRSKDDFLTAYSDYMGVSVTDMSDGELKVMRHAGKSFKIEREKPVKKSYNKIDPLDDDKESQKFNIIAKSRNRIVKSRKVVIYRKGKPIERLRDRKGRFVSRKI